MPKRVTVIIPNWNGREMLEIVLSSLAEQEYDDFSVLVVDNGSDDGSVEYVRERWPDVDVLALPENVGFAPAVNRGIEATGAEYVALLNNDMEVTPTWLGELVLELDRHPEAGSVTSKLLSFHDRDVLDGAGDVLTWSGNANRRGQGELDSGQYDQPGDVFSACGGAALYRRSALREVGLFDEDFFAYLEDVDWGFRAQLRGWKCRYVPSSVAYHVGAATTSRQGGLEVFLARRNQLALVVKNLPLSSLARFWWLILGEQLHALWIALRTRTLRFQLAAWASAARRLPRTLSKRREIQRRRRIGHADLRELILPWHAAVRLWFPRLGAGA